MKGLRVNRDILIRFMQTSGLDDKDIAQACHKSPQTISYIKNGKRLTTYQTLKKIADAIGAPVHVLSPDINAMTNLNKKEIEWARLLHEAALLDLYDYVDGALSHIKAKINEVKKEPSRLNRSRSSVS